MNCHLHRLSREELLEIYHNTAPAHFPADELKPTSTIETLLEQNAYLGLGLFNEANHLMGYALFLTVPDLDVILLDYYAILASYRDLGLGSFFLQKIRKYFHQFHGILIETEDIDDTSNDAERSERIRRNAFYRKNGAILTDIRCTLYDVPFTIFFLETVKDPVCQTDNSDSGNFFDALNCSAKSTQETDLNTIMTQLQAKLDKLYRFMLAPESYAQNVTWR